jgi:MHS family proline/betaine transporter-like MFS transporter
MKQEVYMRSQTRVLVASIFGNALEFYNLTLYGFFVVTIAETFFPNDNALFSLIFSLSGYAIGFVVRPLGAILFGHIGDTWGRRKALGLSILIMGIPSILIAFLPGHAYLGALAPTLLLLCRAVQGLCSGGEFNGATIFALEHLGKKNPGFAGGLIVGSCLLGSLVALGVATLLQSLHLLWELPEWGWRVAFFLGGSASFYGLYIRRKMEESPVFAIMQKEDKIIQKPLKTALSSHLRSCLLVFSIAAFDGALTYTLVTFLVVYTTVSLHIPEAQAMYYNFFGVLACMLACPLSGYWADCHGVRKVLVLSTLGVLLLSLPVFLLVQQTTAFSLITANLLLGFLVGSVIGVQPLFSLSLFPANARYTGIAFSYSLSIGVVGGLTPLILTYLVSDGGSAQAPAFYLMGFAFVFLLILSGMENKRKG